MQTLWLYVLENWSYCRSKFYIAGIGIFNFFCSCDLDLALITFIHELDPYSLKIYRMYEYKLPTSKLLKVIVRHTDKQTQRRLYNTLLHGWSTMQL